MNMKKTPKRVTGSTGAVYVELAVLLPSLAFIGLGFFDLFSAMNRERSLVEYAQQVVVADQLPVMMAFGNLNADDDPAINSTDKVIFENQFNNQIGITGLPDSEGESPWDRFMFGIRDAVQRAASQPFLMLISLDYVQIDGSTGGVRDGGLMHAGSLSSGEQPSIFVDEVGEHGCSVDGEHRELEKRLEEISSVVEKFDRHSNSTTPPGIVWYSVVRTGADGQDSVLQQFLPYLPILTVRLCARPYNVLLGQKVTYQFSMIPKKLLGYSASMARTNNETGEAGLEG